MICFLQATPQKVSYESQRLHKIFLLLLSVFSFFIVFSSSSVTHVLSRLINIDFLQLNKKTLALFHKVPQQYCSKIYIYPMYHQQKKLRTVLYNLHTYTVSFKPVVRDSLSDFVKLNGINEMAAFILTWNRKES